MNLRGNFPTALASFARKFMFVTKYSAFCCYDYYQGSFVSVAQSFPYSNQVMVFGGTAVPFGTSTSSSVHLLSFDNDSDSVISSVISVEGEKLGTYGHAMLRGSDPNTFYVIGGTTGHNFFLDVDKLICKNGTWSWSNEATASPNIEGRYRLEAVLHEDFIYLFGGGRPDHVTELRTLTVFDTKKRTFIEIQTYPDESIKGDSNDGYPRGRRCHSVTKWKKDVILIGGCSADKEGVDARHEGGLLVWGGVLDIYSSVRTNTGQYCYLEPPSLRTLAALALRPYLHYKTIEEASSLRISRAVDLAFGICNNITGPLSKDHLVHSYQ
ncbi:kelch repeat protein [Dictyocaulus viviparus]|uniref:Kelch repeat protein n=1 Tax=Dictyocaulus viviparus TaxID=29172 RepID=A0A0D8Y2U3_DICVI|nr:kelch repeat protein [Dictyocaulus viviparus]